MMLAPRLVIALLALALTGNAQNLWIVASDGSGDYVSLANAINAAADGDTLVVQEGAYLSDGVIDGKGITLVTTDENVSLRGLTIRNIAPGQQVLLRLGDNTTVRDIQVEDSTGTVWMESLAMVNLKLNILNSSSVLITNSTVFNTCANVVDSTLHAYGSTFTGRTGWDFYTDCDCFGTDGGAYPPEDGELAMRLDNSNVFLGGCTVRGGDGGDGGTAPNLGCCFGETYPDASRGPGIVLANGSSLTTTGSTLGSVVGGAPTVLAGSVGDFRVSHLVNSGTNATLTFAGTPGELILLQLSTAPSLFLLPLLGGSWLTRGGPRLRVGTIPASGILTVDVPVSLPSSLPAFTFYLQAVMIDTSATPGTLTPGTALVVCNACF